jgi:hypothetical protein
MSNHLYNLVDQVDNIKEKLTDKEYKDLLDSLMAANKAFGNKPNLAIPLIDDVEPMAIQQPVPQVNHVMAPLADYFNEQHYVLGQRDVDTILGMLHTINNYSKSHHLVFLGHKINQSIGKLGAYGGEGLCASDLKLYWENIKGCIEYYLEERSDYLAITLPRIRKIITSRFGQPYVSEKIVGDSDIRNEIATYIQSMANNLEANDKKSGCLIQ